MTLSEEMLESNPVAMRGRDTSLGQAGFCADCGVSMPAGPDACLGTIPGVSHACCGHGSAKDAYVVLGGQPGQPSWEIDTVTLRGLDALEFFSLIREGEQAKVESSVSDRIFDESWLEMGEQP